MSIYQLMDKENVKYTYNGISFNHKIGRNPALYDNMDEPWEYYAKWNKPVIKGQIIYDSTYMRYLE